MVSVDLGACEWFVWDLRRSNLVERGQLEQLVAEFLAASPQAEPQQLADFLVNRQILTRFQADNLLAGKNQGLVLGPYTLEDALGTGSMGTVYRARSKNNPNQVYAVKVLPRRSMWNVRLARRKVREFEQFQHAAVVPFVDVGTAGGMHYLAWPLVDGESLTAFVTREGSLPASLAAYFALQTAEGLEACHLRGIIHGLIKPSNLLINADRQVRILDFGVGALLSETEGESVVDTMSTANTMASGLDCASPESIMDPTATGPASDQYSLGCVMFYCLTGQFPFPGSSAVEKMMAHQTKAPPAIKELAPQTPDELVRIIEKMMAKSPAQRFPTISDVVAVLKPIAREAALTPAGRMPWLRPAGPATDATRTTASTTTPMPISRSARLSDPNLSSRIAPAQVHTPPSGASPAEPTAPRPRAGSVGDGTVPQSPPTAIPRSDRRSVHGIPSPLATPPAAAPTPRQTSPAAAPAPHAAPVAPAAHTFPGASAAPGVHAAHVAQVAHAGHAGHAPAAAAAPAADIPSVNPADYLDQPTWEDRLGPVGVAILAVASCAAAWLLMWLLNS